MSHACQRFWKCHKTRTFCSLLPRCTSPCACHAKAHLNVQKCSVPVSFFALLTSKCASRHNGVQFFDISTSKSGPTLRCFVHFDLEMCFAPQRRALFRHLNFQKWSGRDVFCTLGLMMGRMMNQTPTMTQGAWSGHRFPPAPPCGCFPSWWPKCQHIY